jgi:hypothetical protein
MSDRDPVRQARTHLNLCGEGSLDQNQKWALAAGEREDRRAAAKAELRAAQAERESIQFGRAIETRRTAEELEALKVSHHDLGEAFLDACRKSVELHNETVAEVDGIEARLAVKTMEFKEEIVRRTDEAAARLSAELRTATDGSHNSLVTALRTVSEGLERIVREGEVRRDLVMRDLEGRILKLDAELAEMRTAAAKQRCDELAAVHEALARTVTASIEGIDEKRRGLAKLISDQEAALAGIKAEVAAELESLRVERNKPVRFAREKRDNASYELPSFLPPRPRVKSPPSRVKH